MANDISGQIGQALVRYTPTLLEKIKKLINDQLDEKLKTLMTNNPMLRGEGGSGVREEEVEAPKKKDERFEFKNFANCHPPEFHGRVDPIISQRWIDEIEKTFMLCEYLEHLKFREMFMDQFAPPAEVSRLKSEFMNIEHGSKSVTEFNAEFNDKSRFCPDFVSSPKLMMDHYHEKLNPKISEFIDKGTYKTLAEMMSRALVREHELKKKVVFKRKLDQDSKSMQSMSPKKGKFNSESPHKLKGGFMPGKSGGKEPGHRAAECPKKGKQCYYCFEKGHFQAECPEYKKDLVSGGVNKEVKIEPKTSDSRPRARAHQITVLEAKESQNVVSGMDWLDDNEGIILCRKKIVLVQAPSGKVIWIYGERARRVIPIYTYARAKRFLSHGCCAFLAHVIDDSKKVIGIDDVPIVNEFPDVFSDELLGVPPEREVEFRIELIPGATKIAKAPYRLAPSEMREMMTQLQDLIDKGFIHPSSSP
ncbi:uncharacterized protein [Rutidosis leptorrhynchoides]|uniref:uncharacterized protein n=1 Tax=Rutidosis leptorrhynchoides TaxID=125765 RepID=UPI003A9907DC